MDRREFLKTAVSTAAAVTPSLAQPQTQHKTVVGIQLNLAPEL